MGKVDHQQFSKIAALDYKMIPHSIIKNFCTIKYRDYNVTHFVEKVKMGDFVVCLQFIKDYFADHWYDLKYNIKTCGVNEKISTSHNYCYSGCVSFSK